MGPFPSVLKFEKPEDLCNFSSNAGILLAAHDIANNLDSGALSELEIQQFMANESRLKAFLSGVFEAQMTLFSLSPEVLEEDRQCHIISPCCSGCNDWGFGQSGRYIDENAFFFAPLLFRQLHLLIISLSVLCHLVTRQDSEMLIALFFSTTLDDLFPQYHHRRVEVMSCVFDSDPEMPFVEGLSGLMKYTDLWNAFPAPRRLAASLMAMIICRRPTTIFSDERRCDMLADHYTTFAHEQTHILWVGIPGRNLDKIGLTRQYFSFLNIIPALYYMGTVNRFGKVNIFLACLMVLSTFSMRRCGFTKGWSRLIAWQNTRA